MRAYRIVILTVALFSALSSFTATRIWTGSQNGNWSNPLNWSPQGVPVAGEILEFPGNARNVGNKNNDLAPYFSVGRLSFNAEAVLNGNPLTVTGDIGFVSSPSAVSSTINVASASPTRSPSAPPTARRSMAPSTSMDTRWPSTPRTTPPFADRSAAAERFTSTAPA